MAAPRCIAGHAWADNRMRNTVERMGRRLARIVNTDLMAEPVESNAAGRSIFFRRNTLGAQVHAALRLDIIAGRLAPRAMLSEQEIAAGLGILRTPVREAMIKLAPEGLVGNFPPLRSLSAPATLRRAGRRPV